MKKLHVLFLLITFIGAISLSWAKNILDFTPNTAPSDSAIMPIYDPTLNPGSRDGSVSVGVLNSLVLSDNRTALLSAFPNFSTAVHDPSTAGKNILVTGHAVCNTLTVPIDRILHILPGGELDPAGALRLTTAPVAPARVKIYGGTGTVSGPGITTVYPEHWGTGRAAFNLAFQLACTGIPMDLQPNTTYDMGIVGDGVNVLAYTNAKLQINGNGATISSTTTAPSQGHTFYLTNPIYAKFNDINLSNPGSDVDVDFEGVHHIFVVSSGTTTAYGNIELHNVTADSGISPITFFGPTASARIQNIVFSGNCVFTNTYYGPLFQWQGDKVRGYYTAVNNRRSYYAYGVDSHNLKINIVAGVNGSDGNVAIASETGAGALRPSTTNIKLDIQYSGVLPFSSPVKFQLQSGANHPANTDGTAAIDNVNVNLNLTGTSSSSLVGAAFRAYDLNGDACTSTTSRWDHIRLSGEFLRGTGVPQSVVAYATQTTKGQLIIDLSSYAPGVTSINMPQIAGFNTEYPISIGGSIPWTPIDASGAGLSLVINGTNECQRYGKIVSCAADITYPTTSNTASAVIGGLPYTSSSIGTGSQFAYSTYSSSVSGISSGSTQFTLYTKGGVIITNNKMRRIKGIFTYEAN
jgi:hypothetical protein